MTSAAIQLADSAAPVRRPFGSAAIDARAREHFDLARHAQYCFTDRLFAVLMALQYVAGIAAALVISPSTWFGATSTTHLHVWAAFVLGAILAIPPIVLAILRPGATVTRHVIAVSQGLFSALLIHLSGGRIETHFHVFGSLAFLAFYRDWSVMLTATSVIAVDHFLRGSFWPQSVFGVATAANWRWLEHAGWVVFEDIFLLVSIRRSLNDMRMIAQVNAELEAGKAEVEQQVLDRTHELEQALAGAECASRTKSAFLANMSHEIRTPMTAILGFAEILETTESEIEADQRAEAVRTIRSNGEHLISVINDILDVSKIEAGKMTVEFISTSLIRIVEDVASLMRVRCAGKAVDLRIEYATPVPETVNTDPVRLCQILNNLVGNAVKFTERGSVTIRVSYAAEDDGADATVRVEVIDTGVGMTPEQTVRVFDPFTQADCSTTRRFGGSGLGLCISSRLVELLGGTLGVTSTPGAGSTFTVALPAGRESEVRLIQPGAAPMGIASSRRPAVVDGAVETPLHGMRVLLAEDGRDNQRLIAFHVTRAGAEVDIVDNGARAVAAVEAARNTRPFDLVLMDMQMPEMDGYEATRTLRDRGFDAPVIALTAHAMQGDREKCLAAGCTDYDTKPIDGQRLIAMCARRLAVGHRHPAA